MFAKLYSSRLRSLPKLSASTILAAALLFIFTITALTFSQFTANFQNFVYQADGFLHGTVFYHTPPPTLHDSSFGKGSYYWAPGPLPALLLSPVVALLGLGSWQIYLSWVLLIAVLILAYKLSRREGYSRDNSLWLTLVFVFASVYLGVAFRAQAWQVSSALAAVVTLGLLWEWRGQNRAWLVGLLAAAALATRPTAALVIFVPLIDRLFTPETTRQQKVFWCIQAAVPIILAGVLLLSLNQARTDSWFDSGYMSAKVSEPLANVRERSGLFAIKNIPTNLYFYFFIPPRPQFADNSYQLQWPYIKANIAMGFFFLSPIFLYLWRLRPHERWQKTSLVVALISTIIILSYYALNAWEFGPRYLVDILPLYFLLVLSCFYNNKLGWRDKALIGLSAAFNLYLFTTIPWWSGG